MNKSMVCPKSESGKCKHINCPHYNKHNYIEDTIGRCIVYTYRIEGCCKNIFNEDNCPSCEEVT